MACSSIMLPVILFILLQCQVIEAYSAPNPPPEALLDPISLSSLSWKVDQKMEEVVQGWPNYLEEQEWEEKSIKRKGVVEILGVEFDAKYLVYNETDAAEITFWADKQPGDFCQKFFEWTKKTFGNPTHFIDRSTPPSDFSMRVFEAGWLFNSVRMQMKCVEALVYEEYVPAWAIIVYRHKHNLEELKDLIHIECKESRTTITIGDKTIEEPSTNPPRRWIIDPDFKQLRRESNQTYGETKLFSDERIIASKTVDESSVEINIDRITGVYLIKLVTKDAFLNEWGTCNKIEPRQKF